MHDPSSRRRPVIATPRRHAGSGHRATATRRLVPARLAAVLVALLVFPSSPPVLADDDRAAREAVEALEAYAVYKMADYETAWERFAALAEKGNVQGMLNAANMRLAGLGIERDPVAAFEWYRRAAARGDATGLYEAARSYELGRGVVKDTDEALRRYREAAEAGSPEARRALGSLLLERGEEAAARRWLTAAADDGDALAARLLAELDGGGSGAGAADAAAGVPLRDASLVRDAWQAIDRAAAAGNAPGVVHYLAHDAGVRVRLPGADAATAMDKRALGALWQRSFDTPGGHDVTRGELRLATTSSGAISVDSTIDETLGGNGGEGLRLVESARVRIVDERVVVETLSLDIERR